MKFLLISDVHATSKSPVSRKDDVFLTFKNKFTFILEYAREHNATILQAGDFFDTPRDWHVLDLIISLLQKYRVPIYMVYGQHDMYMRTEPFSSPTTFGILKKMKLVNFLSVIPTILDNTNIYGCSWGQTILLPTDTNKINILVIHAPITERGLFPKHNFIPTDSFLTKNNNWNLILCGDIHIKAACKKRKTFFVNTGPILRLQGNKYNLRHHPCFFIYDDESRSLEEVSIPHQPARKVITREHIKTPSKTLYSASLEEFARLLKRKKAPISIKKILNSIMKNEDTPEEIKQYLYKIMEDDECKSAN